MNHVWLGLIEKFPDIAEVTPDREPLIKLTSHEALRVADTHYLATRDSSNLRGVIIGDLAAAHDSHFKHGTLRRGNL